MFDRYQIIIPPPPPPPPKKKNVSVLIKRIDVLLDFSLTVRAATIIFIFVCGSAISSANEGKSGFIYNLLKSK